MLESIIINFRNHPVLILIIAFIIYFIPTFVAENRHHLGHHAIMVANFFFGWSLIGWILCLIWACNSNIDREHKGFMVKMEEFFVVWKAEKGGNFPKGIIKVLKDFYNDCKE